VAFTYQSVGVSRIFCLFEGWWFYLSSFGDIGEFIFETVVDVARWERVIAALCEETGCKKGIISLRETDSSRFIVPQSVLESPLIYGFDSNEIESFVVKYQKNDPWTAIEHDNYPEGPIVLSDFLPRSELEKTSFWEWLKPQDISDTVALSLGKYASYWVGFNLYGSRKDCKTAVDFLVPLLPSLRQGWWLGEEFFDLRRSHDLTAEVLSDLPVPIFSFDDDGEVAATSKSLLKMVSSSGQSLSRLLTKDRLASLVANQSSRKSETLEVDDQMWRIFLVSSSDIEDPVGRKSRRYLAMVASNITTRTETIRMLFEATKFSPRQEQLVEHLKQGKSIASFAEMNGIAVDTAYHHWKEIKRLTGVTSPKEIRLLSP
jgi:DNA-binding CsgD family transcriptional regulator